MQNYTATVASPAKIKKALVEFKIKLDDDIEHNAVAFFNDVDKTPEFKDKLLSLKIGDVLEFNGFEKFNDYQKVNEFIVKSTATVELTYEEAMAMPTPGLLPPEERYMPDRKYTMIHPKSKQPTSFWSDGIYFWLEGQKHDKRKLTKKALDNYNNHVKRDEKLLPDWYSLETSPAEKAEMALLEEFSPY